MNSLRHLPRWARTAALAVLLACTLAAVTAGLALAADDTAPPMQDDGEGDDRGEFSECAECHPDVTAAWQDGPHDTAFSIEHFQHSWTELNQPQECLACHTTGFSPATGNYQAEGVTCEACHGEVPDGHPPRPVDLNRANQVCAECHTVTQAEFRASAHSEKGLACTTCHYAHDNGLRADTEVAQCLACHGDELDGFVAHTTHLDNGLSCRDCHGYVTPGHPIPDDGLAPTGHDFQAGIRACLDCHEDIRLEPARVDRATEAEPVAQLDGQRAQLRARQLEAAVETLLLQQRNRTAMNIVQGAAGGLVIGGLVVFLILRRRSASISASDDNVSSDSISNDNDNDSGSDG